uniref:Cytochrome c oxidase subunit 3 n=1 Tax=Paralongidorus litoralis TaxID=474435 RepID=A0A1P8C770_9BILA|nr:cytochrome c oxidase subunit III [Paralongidorus litoralis]AOT84249.1 cytochrome c oxidase subunit III [Paralongidorus litoralis]
MSVLSFFLMINILYWFKFGSFNTESTLVYVFLTAGVMVTWFRDINRESSMQGHHTIVVMKGLKWGLVWFLFSEVWFFFSVFWSFFHMSISPITGSFLSWPMFGLEIIPPFQIPLLNTVILLMSGVTATLAHQCLLMGKMNFWVSYSVGLGVYFLSLQGMEYYHASYSLATGGYGSIFFFGTGFHGMHVCLGTIMLMASDFRLNFKTLSSLHHFGVEFSLWYWHFVDVVWLFLFFWVYTWGG